MGLLKAKTKTKLKTLAGVFNSPIIQQTSYTVSQQTQKRVSLILWEAARNVFLQQTSYHIFTLDKRVPYLLQESFAVQFDAVHQLLQSLHEQRMKRRIWTESGSEWSSETKRSTKVELKRTERERRERERERERRGGRRMGGATQTARNKT